MKNYLITILKIILLMSIFILQGFTNSVVPPNADDIMEKVKSTILGHDDYRVDLEMALVRPNRKEYLRKMKAFYKEIDTNKELTLIIFDIPKDVKGFKTLVHSSISEEDNQWIYIPGINATKRIANNNKSGSFMGSEMANEDLGLMNLFKYRFEYLKEAIHKGQECHVIRSYPKNKYSGYKYVDIYISKKDFLPLYQDYYNKKEVLFKSLNVTWKRFKDKFWLIETSFIENRLNKRKTRLVRSNFQFGESFENAFFDSENLPNVEY